MDINTRQNRPFGRPNIGRNSLRRPASPRHGGRLTLAFVALITLLGLAPAKAAIFNIANGDVAGLKKAIITANTNQQSNIINLAQNGTYTLTAVDNTTAEGANGLPVITPSTPDATLQIAGNGATLTRSTAAGTPNFRILEVAPGAVLQIDGLTISNGNGPAGAAFYNNLATLNLTDCTLLGNTSAGDGGAIYNNGQGGSTGGAAVVTVNGCTFQHNSAAGVGGAIANNGAGSDNKATLTGTAPAFTQNSAAVGGAIWSSGSAEGNAILGFSGASFANNQSTGAGGAIYDEALTTGNTTLNLSTSDLANNKAGGNGGAVSVEADANALTANVIADTFRGNTGVDGGALYLNFVAETATVSNCTFNGNTATAGGGLFVDGPEGRHTNGATVRFCTFNLNSVSDSLTSAPFDGSGVYVKVPITLYSSLVVAPSGTQSLVLSPTGTPSLTATYNLTNDYPVNPQPEYGGARRTAILNPVQGNLTDTNPKLGALQNNGGPTLTCLPGSGSSAINHGDPTYTSLSETDQRGLRRASGGRADIGAVETQVLSFTAPNLSYTAYEDASLTTNILNNNPGWEAVIITAPAHGKAVLLNNGFLQYTPDAGFYGTDTLQYQATKMNDINGVGVYGSLWSNVATVTITVTPVATNVTNLFNVQQSAIYPTGTPGQYAANITLQCLGVPQVNGPVYLVVAGLPQGVKLLTQTGVTVHASPAGIPYLLISNGSLPYGLTFSFTLIFSSTSASFSYTPQVYAGGPI